MSAPLNSTPPPAFKWFVAYCVLMALLYLTMVVMGFVFAFIQPDPKMSEAEARMMGAVIIPVALVFFVPFALAPFLPRKSWAWVFGLVLICIGLTSLCCLPACIPLLLQWLKPEMKAFYGRMETPLPPQPPQWT